MYSWRTFDYTYANIFLILLINRFISSEEMLFDRQASYGKLLFNFTQPPHSNLTTSPARGVAVDPSFCELAKQILSCGFAEQKLQERLGTYSPDLRQNKSSMLPYSSWRRSRPKKYHGNSNLHPKISLTNDYSTSLLYLQN